MPCRLTLAACCVCFFAGLSLAADAPATPDAPAAKPLFATDSLEGWKFSHWADLREAPQVEGTPWKIESGVLYGLNKRTWIYTEREYGDFVLTLEAKITPGGNGGIGLRFPPEGDPAYRGMEIQLVDDRAYYRGDSQPQQRTGSVYDEIAAKEDASKPAGEWNTFAITCRGSRVKITVNGKQVVDADLAEHREARQEKGPALAERPRRGRIGFQNLNGLITVRNMKIAEW